MKNAQYDEKDYGLYPPVKRENATIRELIRYVKKLGLYVRVIIREDYGEAFGHNDLFGVEARRGKLSEYDFPAKYLDEHPSRICITYKSNRKEPTIIVFIL